MAPPQIAQKIGDFVLENLAGISKFQVVQGFLNFSLADELWAEALLSLQNDPQAYTLANKNEKILIEYSSPNTNKPLHLGHLRNNFLGFSVAQILAAWRI